MADIHYHKYNVTGSIAALNVLISSYEYYKKSNDSVKEYLKLQEKLNSNKFADRLTSIITKRKMKELEKNNNIVTQFKVLQNNISLIQKAKNDILESKEYQTLLKATETQDNIEKLRKAERENLKKVLNEKATSVLALAYVKLYQDNFELLRMSSVGAQEKLLKLTTQDAEYYSKAAIEKVGKNVDYWLSVENVASQLHQQWREGRKNPDGTYEPRWKKVKDNAFIETVLATKNLPANIKVVDGEVQLDIANTSFDDLCLDYQIENFEAAQIALEVAKIKYTRAEAGKVGKIIHDEWLERNGWAKGSDLDVEFEELIFSEKVKDLIQYEIAKDVVKQEVRTDLI